MAFSALTLRKGDPPGVALAAVARRHSSSVQGIEAEMLGTARTRRTTD